MAEGKNTVKMVVLLVVIAVALAFVIKAAIPTRYRPPDVDWACESCDHLFVARSYPHPGTCPRRGCGGEVVRTYIYYDTSTGELVEVYRDRPGISDDPMEPGSRLVKVPGGEWGEFDYRIEVESGFPVPVKRPQDLKYAPPGSEYRK